MIVTGLETKLVLGATPSFSAVASTNGLNEEPACRSPWTARLNWLLRKLLPPNMASTRPSRGSTATRAAVGPAGFVSHCPIELRAIFWIFRSIVVSTFSPPPKTRPDPYRSTSCCLT